MRANTMPHNIASRIWVAGQGGSGVYSRIMRITGGRFKGLRLGPVKGRARPTQDMVREAMFSILGDRVEGARFLDLFAGSGIVGMEAMSRGASEICWVDVDRRACAALREFTENLQGMGGRVINGDIRRILKKTLYDGAFDIIFADPPYVKDVSGKKLIDWDSLLLKALESFETLKSGGLYIFECRRNRIGNSGHFEKKGWSVIDIRSYGGTALVFRNLDQ